MNYTAKDRAFLLVDMFEDLLDDKNLEIECDDPVEEKERHISGNDAKLYGMEYWRLVDRVEDFLKKEEDKMIKDSGDRTEFKTGAKRDMHSGKGRMDLLPWYGIMEVSKHCEEGALKYGEHNVDKGIPLHSLLDSASRHLAKYMAGMDDEDHLRAACWNLLWALNQRVTHPELDDRFYTKAREEKKMAFKCSACGQRFTVADSKYYKGVILMQCPNCRSYSARPEEEIE